MNRREAITAMAGVLTVAAADGQTPTIAGDRMIGNTYTIAGVASFDPAERKKQYAICKERGHAAGEWPFSQNTIYTWPPQVPMSACKFCGTLFRFVTTTKLEESNTP